MKYQIPLYVILMIALTSTGAAAIWLNGFSISGLFSATSGSQGVEETETWDINITSDDNITTYFTYNNPNGETSVTYMLIDNISSSAVNCNYEPDKDVKFYLKNDGVECHLTESSNCGYIMHSGQNDVNVTVVPHTNRCPLEGTWEVYFAV